MQNPLNRIPERLRPAVIAFVAFIVGIIIISILALSGIFHRNPYGPETKIDNFSKYYRNAPTATSDMIFRSLHNIVALNTENEEEVPTSGATIRNNSTTNDYNQETNIHTGTFITDVEPIKQSFKVWFEWSDDQENTNLSGYQLKITCLVGEESLYGSTSCEDGSTSTSIQNLYTRYPFLSQLPLDVSYYHQNFTGYTHYRLSYLTNEANTEITFIITDYTGNSRQAALTKLQGFGINIASDVIEYRDLSAEDSFGRPPDGN